MTPQPKQAVSGENLKLTCLGKKTPYQQGKSGTPNNLIISYVQRLQSSRSLLL